MVTLSWETLIQDSYTWSNLPKETLKTIIYAIWPKFALKLFQVFWVKLVRLKTHIQTLMHTVDAFYNTMVIYLFYCFRYGWKRFLHSCFRCFKSIRLPFQRCLVKSFRSSNWKAKQYQHWCYFKTLTNQMK